MKKTALIITVIILLVGAVVAGYLYLSGGHLQLRLSLLERQIEAVIDREASNISQCNSVAFGAKPCGGPWSYLIYSEESTNVDRLENLVGKYNEIQSRQNEILGASSDCMIVTPPQLQLEEGVCVR